MKYLIVNDEHELYKYMFSDLFDAKNLHVEEIKRIDAPKLFSRIIKIHFNDKINRRIWLPFKSVRNRFYGLSKYNFSKDEQYWIIFLNGSLRYHFSKHYLEKLKSDNIKICLILYDSFCNASAKRSISMVPLFDKVFSFDKEDCNKHNLSFLFSTLSYPKDVYKDIRYETNAFFVGFGEGRLEILKDTFLKISAYISNCKFIIAGVKKKKQKKIPNVEYNQIISYKDELLYSYNTNCIIEVVKDGQTGITLRTCEAIMFNKKLLTNNKRILEMPFYNAKYIHVFDTIGEEEINFIKNKIDVDYQYDGYFSPLRIIQELKKANKEFE